MSQEAIDMISIRVSKDDKLRFKLLAKIKNKSLSAMIKEMVNKELSSVELTAKDLRDLPKKQRNEILKQMTEKALPVYKKYEKRITR